MFDKFLPNKIGKKYSNNSSVKKVLNPKSPSRPTYLPHLSREFKKGGHTTGREREGKRVGGKKSTQKFSLIPDIFTSIPTIFGPRSSREGISMKGRQHSLRRCRFARNQRLPRTKEGRSRIKAASFKYGHENVIDFTGEMSRVNERRPHLCRFSCKMSIRPSSLLVVAVLACCVLDPREPQQVIVAAGLHPHPGPKKQLQPEPEQMEKDKDEAKRPRCGAPPSGNYSRATLA